LLKFSTSKSLPMLTTRFKSQDVLLCSFRIQRPPPICDSLTLPLSAVVAPFSFFFPFHRLPVHSLPPFFLFPHRVLPKSPTPPFLCTITTVSVLHARCPKDLSGSALSSHSFFHSILQINPPLLLCIFWRSTRAPPAFFVTSQKLCFWTRKPSTPFRLAAVFLFSNLCLSLPPFGRAKLAAKPGNGE